MGSNGQTFSVYSWNAFLIPLPRLAVVTFSLRYRVSDFVGGHLTGIMITDLPLEVVQFFCTLFCHCHFAILAHLDVQRTILPEFLCESADANLKSCILPLKKLKKRPDLCKKFARPQKIFF